MMFAPVVDIDGAVAARERWRAEGKRVVFTNGCFDILHPGHVSYLAWAREQGDVLILGLNSDGSVRTLKGPLRPIVLFSDRAHVLAALRSIDLVVGFEEQTPEALLERIRPDIHVKSAQYRLEDLPERAVVERGGGRVALAPHLVGQSTTDVITTISERYGRQAR